MKIAIVAALNAAFVVGGSFAGSLIGSDASRGSVVDGTSASPEGLTSVLEGQETEEVQSAPEADMMVLRFSRPFVVPVTDGSRTQSLVILTLSVELDRDLAEGMTALENKMRDRVMAALLDYSHEGGFVGDVTSPSVYSGVEKSVTAAASEIFAEGVGRVTILEMVRRDT